MPLPAVLRWRLRVEFSGEDITDRTIGDVNVAMTEDAAAIARLTMVEAGEDRRPSDYINQPVSVFFETLDATGAVTSTAEVFRGAVQTATFDLPTRTVAIAASDQLQAAVEALTRPEVETLSPDARWHEALFTRDDNQWEYLQQRLSTQCASVHRAVDGSVIITPWDTDVAPRYSLDAGDIYDGTLNIDFGDRRDRPDIMRLNVQLRYPRRWRRTLSRGWTYPRDFEDYVRTSSDLPSRDMIRSAAEGVSGWNLDAISFAPVWADGRYVVDASPVFFSHEQETYVVGATMNFSRTWTQTVTDIITIEMIAYDEAVPPANPVAIDATVSVDVDASVSDEDAPDTPALTVFGKPVWRYDNDGRDDLDEAMTVAVSRATRTFVSQWRETTVSAEVPCLATLTLADRIDVQTGDILATGKVRAVEHRFTDKSATTRLHVALFDGRCTGDKITTYDGTKNLPATEAPDAFSFSPAAMITQLDDGTATPHDPDRSGFSGNMIGQSDYPYSFSVDVPAPPAELRDAHEDQRSFIHSVCIPGGDVRMWPTSALQSAPVLQLDDDRGAPIPGTSDYLNRYIRYRDLRDAAVFPKANYRLVKHPDYPEPAVESAPATEVTESEIFAAPTRYELGGLFKVPDDGFYLLIIRAVSDSFGEHRNPLPVRNLIHEPLFDDPDPPAAQLSLQHDSQISDSAFNFPAGTRGREGAFNLENGKTYNNFIIDTPPRADVGDNGVGVGQGDPGYYMLYSAHIYRWDDGAP